MRIPEYQITIKRTGSVTAETKKISNSQTAAAILREMFSSDTFLFQEEFIILCLNRANIVHGFYRVSRGGTTGTVADPKVIFTMALNTPGTCGLILSHNHPSGNPNPSPADIELTKKLKESGKMLDINVLDHIILTDTGYTSLTDEGLM